MQSIATRYQPISAVQPPAAENPAVLGERELVAGFSSQIRPVEVPLLYRVGMGFLALLMILLPLVYLALIAATGYYTHQLVHSDPADPVYFLYLIGGVVILFMIKPLFARRPKSTEPVYLERSREPKLFAFVDRICDTVGSPKPSAISVDTQVNASAGFRRGALSMFGNDLVLSVGLPLVAGLSLRQLTGILAHEFGHFAQGTGMRLTYIIRSVNAWFARVVYDRDGWDEWITRASKSWDIRFAIVLYAIRLCVWATRKVLWVLMIIGHGFSCFASRQMEYDADRYEARVVGSDVFKQTVYALQSLGAASEWAYGDLDAAWAEHRLSDDLPALILFRQKSLPDEARELVRQMIEEQETGLFDTHPADPDRIRSAEAEAALGVFRMAGPATVLFTDFKKTSVEVTLEYYRDITGEQVQPSMLIKTEKLVAQQEQIAAGDAALEEFLGIQQELVRKVGLEIGDLSGDTPQEQLVASLTAARNEMSNALQPARAGLSNFEEGIGRELTLIRAEAFLRAKFRIDRKDFELPQAKIEVVRDQLAGLDREQGARLQETRALSRAAATRMSAGLRLYGLESIRQKLPAADRMSETLLHTLKAPLAALNDLEPTLDELANCVVALAALIEQLEDGSDADEDLYDGLMHYSEKLVRLMGRIRSETALINYPYSHGKGDITLADYLIEEIPASDEIGSVYQAAHRTNDLMGRLHYRILGQLAALVLQVEKAVGLNPLKFETE